MRNNLLPRFFRLAAPLLATLPMSAQCTNVWLPSTGPGGAVYALAALPNGDLVAGGAAGTVTRRTGTTWTQLGGSFNGPILAVAEAPNGDIVAGGPFTVAGGTPANHVARWNGTTWSGLGSGVDDTVFALLVLPNGDVVVGGAFTMAGGAPANRIARWNGAWSSQGAGLNARVDSLAMLPNGDLVAGGLFTTAGGITADRIARWNGAAWSPLGAGMTGVSVYSLLVLPNGDLIAGGDFASAGTTNAVGIARWDGAAWSAMGSTQTSPTHLYAYRTARLPNGDLLAAGDFTVVGSVGSFRLSRWDGIAWTPGAGTTYGVVEALVGLPSGDLAFGGTFHGIGGSLTQNFAQLSTSCAATVQSVTAGCAGTVAGTLPWIGSPWHAHATGLPNAAMVFVVAGLAATSLPLAAVFPTALPGCTLDVRPDFVELTSAVQGEASASLQLPNLPSLAGVLFQLQMTAIALDPTLAVTSTNALEMQIGAF